MLNDIKTNTERKQCDMLLLLLLLSKETMEKLTWLATERRLSQEGDSEEENSQEENSEPEEEEEEEEGEGIESLQKDDEICGDISEEPKSAFPLTKTAPQVEAHRMPAGKFCGFL